MAQASEAPDLGPIETTTLQELVYRRLREALITGQYGPGHVLQVRALAQTFGVSTMPVREAQMRLAAERALEMLPNRAIRVPVLDDAQIEELYAMRITLEGGAGRKAAGRFDSADLAALVATQEKMEAAMAARSIDDVMRLNARFHFAIYRAGTTSICHSVIESLWMISGPIICAPLRRESAGLPAGSTEATRENHRAMIDGLRRQDGEAVARAIEADLTGALAAFRSTLSREGEPS